eukprot:SAG11_NODE_3651_length_2310_cov_1.335142_3_plen_107_part_00
MDWPDIHMILISMRASSNVGSISDTSSDEDDEEQEQQSEITPRPLRADVAPPSRPRKIPPRARNPKSPIDDHNAEASTPTRNFGTEVQRRDEDTEDDIGEDYDADL